MSHQPLAGRRVIELGTMVAAPFATHILAQLGRRGDQDRAADAATPPATWSAAGRAARSSPTATPRRASASTSPRAEGKEVFRKLVATADVVIHNLAPGRVAQAGGDAPTTARAVNPDIIHSTSRATPHGPQADDLRPIRSPKPRQG